jgi:uncharacterized protein
MRTRRYWLRLILLLVVALLFAVVAVPMVIGGGMIGAIMHSGCAHSGRTPADVGMEYEDVEFTSGQDIHLRGFFMSGTNGATVLIVTAISGDRAADLPDAAILNGAGFNVLTFDARNCADAGYHSLGYQEADDAEAAYNYLLTRDDVDPQRISIQGFSSAGSTSLFTAARIPGLRGVVAKGGYHDFAAQLGVGFSQSDPISFLITKGAELSYRLTTGNDVRVLSPLNVIDQISPRPILLIYGSLEITLPGARRMQERANANGGNAELWVVEGARHGNYLTIAGEEYEQRIVDFHTRVLLDS